MFLKTKGWFVCMEVTLCKQISADVSGHCSVSVLESTQGAPGRLGTVHPNGPVAHGLCLSTWRLRALWGTSSTGTQSFPSRREGRTSVIIWGSWKTLQ